MPFARIDLAQGKPPEYRSTVGDVVYEGIVGILKAPDGDRFMVIGEHAPENFVYDRRCCMKGADTESNVLPPHCRGLRPDPLALRHALMSHDLQRPAANPRLGRLPGQSPTRYAVAEDRLDPEHRRLHQ